MNKITVLVHHEREIEIEVSDAELKLLLDGSGPGYDAVEERITNATDEQAPCPDGMCWLGTTVLYGDKELWSVS